jgi:hypothetical protein
MMDALPCEGDPVVSGYRAPRPRSFVKDDKDHLDKGWIAVQTFDKGHSQLDLLTGKTDDDDDDAFLASEVNAVNQDATNDDEDEGPPQMVEESSSATDSSSEVEDDSDHGDDYDVTDEEGTLRFEFVNYLASVSELIGHDNFYKEIAENKIDFIMQSLEQWTDDVHATVKEGQKKKVWEVFIDQGGTSKELLRYFHVEVIVFSIQNGSDFSKPKLIQQFLDLLDAEEPDEVFFAPPCHL